MIAIWYGQWLVGRHFIAYQAQRMQDRKWTLTYETLGLGRVNNFFNVIRAARRVIICVKVLVKNENRVD